METQSVTPEEIPQRLGSVSTGSTYSSYPFTRTLTFVKANRREFPALRLTRPDKLTKHGKKSLKLLPKAFGLNRTIQKLRFEDFKVDHVLVADAFKAGIRKSNVTCIEFQDCRKISNIRLFRLMCEGMQERSEDFELVVSNCTFDLVKIILEASYLKCFCLNLSSTICIGLDRPLKNLFKGTLCYITLFDLIGLKDHVFLELGRCLSMLPRLVLLDLTGTPVPTAARKRMHESLRMLLGSARSNVFEKVGLGKTVLDDKLSFVYSKLLQSDQVREFVLHVKEDLSTAVAKSISSVVINTKKLEILRTGHSFASGTDFENFNLQDISSYQRSPFEMK